MTRGWRCSPRISLFTSSLLFLSSPGRAACLVRWLLFGDSCGYASPLGTSGGNLLQVTYLKPLGPRDSDTNHSNGVGGWASFLTRLGHHFSIGHIPYFKLKFSLALGIRMHNGGLIYFSVCFDQKFIFLVHFLSQSGKNM